MFLRQKKITLLYVLLLVCGCHKVPEQLEPKINYAVQDRYLKQLPAPFPTLSSEELQEAWGKEYLIGIAFAHQLDLYQSITAFKRAEILAPEEAHARKLEMNYEMLLCYYLGKKYTDVIYLFDTSLLRTVDPHFPAYHDLLVILYEAYTEIQEERKAEQILFLIQQHYPETAEKLSLSTALSQANMVQVEAYTNQYPDVQQFFAQYQTEKKSVGSAQALNALLPGAGYLYVGQKQSALTAFLLNGLFIAAAYHFFHKGDIAAGAIVTSFEAGWYFGGIYGAGEEAKFYNERLYEKYASPLMNQNKLFPVLMLQYAF